MLTAPIQIRGRRHVSSWRCWSRSKKSPVLSLLRLTLLTSSICHSCGIFEIFTAEILSEFCACWLHTELVLFPPPLGHIWGVLLVWRKGILRKLSLCYSIVYCYNDAQRYEHFLQVGRLYRALIVLGLALCHPSASISSISWCLLLLSSVWGRISWCHINGKFV